jgi:hypothetical protein
MKSERMKNGEGKVWRWVVRDNGTLIRGKQTRIESRVAFAFDRHPPPSHHFSGRRSVSATLGSHGAEPHGLINAG